MLKLNKSIKLISALGLTTAILVGCQSEAQNNMGKEISPEDLSYRKTPLTKNTVPPPVEFTKAPPGQSKRLPRSYENAPPLIPHSVEGLLPITKNNNACLGCHDPKVAKTVGATPLSPTHFIDFDKLVEGKIVHLTKMDPARFNCSQCHVPQANAKPLVRNTFQPDYRNPEEKHKSVLNKNVLEGVY